MTMDWNSAMNIKGPSSGVTGDELTRNFSAAAVLIPRVHQYSGGKYYYYPTNNKV